MTFDILIEQGANDREEAALQLALRALVNGGVTNPPDAYSPRELLDGITHAYLPLERDSHQNETLLDMHIASTPTHRRATLYARHASVFMRRAILTRCFSATVFGGAFYFSRASNRVDTPGVISRRTRSDTSRFTPKAEALGRENPTLPRRTERRECVESICHGAGHVDTNRQEGPGKKYSHFPRSGERRQGLAMGSGREMEIGARAQVKAPRRLGQRVRIGTGLNQRGPRNVIIARLTNCPMATYGATRHALAT
ncbi:hypothetical protein DBV15_01109 [Temnothorax longispinosus]|uniref:Uncharacterized protein n=1 Tax=Temnothorax longispinosus TaxID=300112 RepID=A0A4S2J9Z0_9HYME|nr:hypothetical protein DBV15_01109 [Temnothorax longispinosus]